jgi:hypothetical protein
MGGDELADSERISIDHSPHARIVAPKRLTGNLAAHRHVEVLGQWTYNTPKCH